MQHCHLSCAFVIIVLSWVTTAARGGSLTLWPSDLCDVRQRPDSSIRVDAGRTVHVTTGTRYTWPGATVFFKAGETDLSQYLPLRVTVSNATDRTLTITLGVKDYNKMVSSPNGIYAACPWLR